MAQEVEGREHPLPEQFDCSGLQPSSTMHGSVLFLFDVVCFLCPSQVSVFICRENRKVKAFLQVTPKYFRVHATLWTYV